MMHCSNSSKRSRYSLESSCTSSLARTYANSSSPPLALGSIALGSSGWIGPQAARANTAIRMAIRFIFSSFLMCFHRMPYYWRLSDSLESLIIRVTRMALIPPQKASANLLSMPSGHAPPYTTIATINMINHLLPNVAGSPHLEILDMILSTTYATT